MPRRLADDEAIKRNKEIINCYEMILRAPELARSKRADRLHNYLVAKGYTVEISRGIISAAKIKFQEFASLNLVEKRERALRERESLILRAREAGNLKVELDAMKDRDIIDGIYIQKVEHTGTVNVILQPASQCQTQ